MNVCICISGMDIYICIYRKQECLEEKLILSRRLWEGCVDLKSNTSSGPGVTDEQEQNLRKKLGDQEALDLHNFLTYIPHFIILRGIG